MTPPLFRTRITELFGIDHPLLCGGLMWLANANYVGAVVNAGGMGFITPRSFPSEEAYRDELKKCRDITGGTNFGVNIYVSARPEANEALGRFLDIAIEEGVQNVETAGFSPKVFLPRIKDAGMRIIHKCMVQGALAAKALDVPFILGGGMGTGRQLVAALALGADGILLGSRMTVSEEIWADEKYKQRVVAAAVSDTRIVMSIFNDNSRVLDNETARAVSALEAEGITDFEAYRPLVQGIIQREAYAVGDPERGTLSMGQSCAFADRIESVDAIFDGILSDAAEARDRMKTLGA